LDLYKVIYGERNQRTAARMTNLGFIFFKRQQLDSAQYYFSQAEAVYTMLENGTEEMEKNIPVLHAELLNNMAAIEASQRKFSSAENYLQKALELLPEGNEYNRVKFLKSLGAVYDYQNKTNEARNCWQQAYEIALRIYGKDHPVTAELASYLAP
jgi:tetratricopeptide (TPR) repeat protein